MGIFGKVGSLFSRYKKGAMITTAAVLVSVLAIKEKIGRSAPLDDPTKIELSKALNSAVSVEDVMKVADDVLASSNANTKMIGNVIDQIKYKLMQLNSLSPPELIKLGLIFSGDENHLIVIKAGLNGRLALLTNKNTELGKAGK